MAQDGPRWPQDGARMAQHGSKLVARWPTYALKMCVFLWFSYSFCTFWLLFNVTVSGLIFGLLSASMRLKKGPRWLQDGLKMDQEGPKRAPRRPKMAQDGSKMAQDGSKMAQDVPKTAQDGPRWL